MKSIRFLLAVSLAGCAAPSDRAVAGDQGRFIRTYWSISRGEGDGSVTNRVNSPDTATGRFKDRKESKANGLLKLSIEERPEDLRSASLYLELWGGHPGVANKTLAANGHAPVPLPEVGAAEKNCTYSYPSVPIDLRQLVAGENRFQFGCDRGSTFWGHYLFEVAALNVELRRAPFPFAASVVAEPDPGKERIALRLAGGDASRIASVEYHGRYAGYDENGDGKRLDWHGYTKVRKPMGLIGIATEPPFHVAWDVSMLPDQDHVAVRSRVRFKDAPEISYETPSREEIAFPRAGARVALHEPRDLPRPFWSRASRVKTCSIHVPEDPSKIERAELHVTIWDGGRGKTEHPFTLNGHSLPVAGKGRHDFIYRVVPVDPSWLRKGENEIRLLSDTTHHGIEVLLPGPALVVRAAR